MPNTTGFLNILQAARKAGAQRVVYASSSSVYGDIKASPKVEAKTGRLLSPYAVSKMVDELYAGVFASGYSQQLVGLRYFNVFGPRQDPNGAYAAVIPRWIQELVSDQPTQVYGDGKTSRDFCYVANVVQANLLAATVKAAPGHAYNVAVGQRTTLNELHRQLRQLTGRKAKPMHADFRQGDVRHSLASIAAAKRDLGYAPTHTLEEGLALTVPWFVR